MSPRNIERALQAMFNGVIATVSGATLAGCGTPTCDTSFTPQTYDITYNLCGPTDAGACFVSCVTACAELKPPNDPGMGTCASFTNATDAAVAMASCQTELGCTGRQTEGLVVPTFVGSANSALFAKMAWLEAASVHAFRRLAHELRAHEAPHHLVDHAMTCAADEVRHAKLMNSLAEKYGAYVPPVVGRHDVPVRSIEFVAHENAIEGCVSETFGALFAAWSMTHTTNADIADAMRQIAPDELRHAALGWAVAAWANTRLSSTAQRRVREARHTAARNLADRVTSGHAALLAQTLAEQLIRAS